jgi:hypothetical protein
MARKTITRTLSRLPLLSAFGKNAHKSDELLEILRRVALTNQTEQPQPFYSLRQIATHFRLPISSVSRVYRRLEQEGLLSRVRASKTILQGSHYDRRLSVRAFIGLPASLSKFVTLQDYRVFFMRIRRELRIKGFATAMVFFERDEAATANYAERLKSHEVDTVLWFRPQAGARHTLLRLADWGIRLVAVTEEPSPPVFCRYRIRRATAISRLLQHWQVKVGEPVTVVQSESRSGANAEGKLLSALDELSIRYDVAAFHNRKAEEFVRRLSARKTGGIIFESSRLSSLLCFRVPDSMFDLLRRRPVAFLNGPVNMPFTRIPDVEVDLVTIDWDSFAKMLVNDLVTQEAFDCGSQTIFEADLQLRVPLGKFAQEI